MRHRKNGIPDRWLPYSPMGSVVPGTRFIACKVPLKDALLRIVPEEKRFGPKDLMKSFPKIGLLIDLTNTTRYYMKEDFTIERIKYEKIFCPGHVVPPNSIVKEFFSAVDRFLDEHKESDSLIAVHCTHGVNRTGYFICRYMIEKLKIPPEDAVERFQIARGHNIERKNYVDDLKNGCKGGFEVHLSHVNRQVDNRNDRKRKRRKTKPNTEMRNTTRHKRSTSTTSMPSDKQGPKQPSHSSRERHREIRTIDNNYFNSQRPPNGELNRMIPTWQTNSQARFWKPPTPRFYGPPLLQPPGHQGFFRSPNRVWHRPPPPSRYIQNTHVNQHTHFNT